MDSRRTDGDTTARHEGPARRRRELLVGAGAVGALLLAGCSESGSGPEEPAGGNAAPEPDDTGTETRTYQDPKPNLDVTSFTPRIEERQPVVEVTVENVGDESATGTLIVATTVENETVEREQPVSLEPGAARTYTLTFDLSAEKVSDIDAIDFTWKGAT